MILIDLLKFVFVSLSLYLVGAYILSKILDKTIPKLLAFVLSFNIGLALFLLISHLLGFATKSFAISSISTITIYILLSIWLFFSKQIKSNYEESSLSEKLLLFFSLAFGTLSFLKNHYTGIGDPHHLGYAGNLIFNNYYPPRLLENTEVIFDFYHYGIDAILGFFYLILPNIGPFDTHGLLLGFSVFSTLTIIFYILNLLVKSKSYCLFASLFIITFVCLSNSLEYLLKELAYFDLENLESFSRGWVEFSGISTDFLANNSASIAIINGTLYPLIGIFFLLNIDTSDYKKNWLFFLCVLIFSFFSYFTFPAFWFSTIGFTAAWYLVQIIRSKRIIIKPLLFYLLAYYSGKVLTFTTHQSEFNGIELLEFNPHTTWTVGLVRYLNYFYNNDYLRTLATSFDAIAHKYKLEIPIFSSLTFREFGLIVIVAIALFISYVLVNKRQSLWQHAFFISSGLLSLIPVFMFTFIISPVETTRFIFWAKLLFLIISCVLFYDLIESKSNLYSRISKILIYSIILIGSVPGILSFIPNPIYSLRLTYSDEDKNLYKLLRKYHHSGDVILYSQAAPYQWATTVPQIAGFFGIGGIMLKPEYNSQRTAVFLLNPRLLEEMHVDYILLNTSNSISTIGIKRLQNSQLFEEIPELGQSTNNKYHLFRFIANNKTVEQYDNDYLWVVGYQNGSGVFEPLSISNQIFQLRTKAEANSYIQNLRPQIQEKNKILALYLQAQAFPINKS